MSKTRETTYQSQYRQYLEEYNKLLDKGKIRKVEVGGNYNYQKPMDYKTFKRRFDDMLPNNESRKYSLGKDIAKGSTEYTEKQYKHFRKNVEANLSKIDKQSRIEIEEIMKGHYTTAGTFRAEWFEANAADIMEIFWGAGGSKYIPDT